MAKEETAVATIDPTDIWGRVPPEEKFELMAKAQARGVGAALTVVIIGCTLAVGFKFDWLMWGALLLSPLLFQFVAGKTWRDMRPPIMLEYLAARSASRRYAFTTKSQDLFLQLIFRAHVEQVVEDEKLGALNKAFDKYAKVPVWVALFNDCVVMITERQGGAECVFAHLLDGRLTIRGESPESGDEYANDRQVDFKFVTKKGEPKHFRLTSRYPAALVVFERKALQLQKERKELALPAATAEDSEGESLDKWADQA